MWHNLAGVRLQQEDWKRAASLAQKSNSYATEKNVKLSWLRVRNWVIVSLACEGMGDADCANEAKKRAHILANQ